MSKIKLLPIEQAKKIAAGEVIERPANAFKELVENSIDANAKNITIYLEDAGKKLIRIIDDGCGMSEEDAKLCIEHHATSKISSIEDLQTIKTFGFRGEALSAISSVSLINLITKEAYSETGISLEIENGNIIKQSNISCNTGTDISIKDLFWNIPARKKFLKSKETELRSIVQIFFAFCLNYPKIHFKLFHNQKLLYNCPRVLNLENKLRQIYDTYLVENILFFDVKDDKNSEEQAPLKVNGAVSNPNYSRFDRNQIFLFVNNRWVKNYKLVSSIIKGYQNILQERKYPVAFIFISIDPREIDINIHPRKEEVQFLHPKVVENLIENTVKQTLEEYLNSGLGKKLVKKFEEFRSIYPFYIKETRFELQNNFVNSEMEKEKNIISQEMSESNVEANSSQKDLVTSALERRTPDGQARSNFKVKEISTEQEFLSILENRQISEISQAQLSQAQLDKHQIQAQVSLIKDSQATLEYQLIGQSFLTYIILQTDNGITIIDQHAAHERIIYEKIKKQFDKIDTVKLIFPQVVNLLEDDIILIGHYLDLFARFGVIIEQISKNQLIILQTPVFLKNQPLDDVIKQAISIVNDNKYLSGENLKNLLTEKIHAQLSCKSAIKAGQELSYETMNQLIKEFYLTFNRMTCPHGRPTSWILTKSEIEKKFKRDYR